MLDYNHSVFADTIFWCQNGDVNWNHESPISGTTSVMYSGNHHIYNDDNVYLGGVTRTEMTTDKSSSYYYSYDIKLINIQEFITTPLDNRGNRKSYSEI